MLSKMWFKVWKTLTVFTLFHLDSASDIIITFARSISENSTLWEKILGNVGSVANFISDNELLLLPGGLFDVTSRLTFKIIKELNNPMPMMGFDME